MINYNVIIIITIIIIAAIYNKYGKNITEHLYNNLSSSVDVKKGGHININQFLQNQLDELFKKVSKYKYISLDSDNCKKEFFVYTNLTPIIRKEINQVIIPVIGYVNDKSKYYKFEIIDYQEATIITDYRGNKQFIVNIHLTDPSQYMGLRVEIDVIKYINNNKSQLKKSCNDLTNPGFKSYFGGYPAVEQLIPLPSEVIPTANTVLSLKGINLNNSEPIEYLYLNHIRTFNSNLIIDYNNKKKYNTVADNDHSSLEHTSYNGENNPYQDNAVERNKWIKLNDQPKRVRGDWPCTYIPFQWDSLGLQPDITPDSGCPGKTSSEKPFPVTPQFWRNNYIVPKWTGEYQWLFDLTRAGTPQNIQNI